MHVTLIITNARVGVVHRIILFNVGGHLRETICCLHDPNHTMHNNLLAGEKKIDCVRNFSRKSNLIIAF